MRSDVMLILVGDADGTDEGLEERISGRLGHAKLVVLTSPPPD